MTEQWEYFVRTFELEHRVEIDLNNAGRAGWELVAYNFQTMTAIFKRPVAELIPFRVVGSSMEAPDGNNG